MANNAYNVLMEQQFNAHQEFHRAWDENAQNGAKTKEAIEVSEAREKFFAANDKLWNTLLDPLQSKFNTDPTSVVDDVIDFLEIDIPAFRCGYLKEYFLERLKSIDLSIHQKDRLRNAALNLCKENTVRREFRRWVNLMISFADEQFINKLQNILIGQVESKNRATKLMLQGILKHHKDLNGEASKQTILLCK